MLSSRRVQHSREKYDDEGGAPECVMGDSVRSYAQCSCVRSYVRSKNSWKNSMTICVSSVPSTTTYGASSGATKVPICLGREASRSISCEVWRRVPGYGGIRVQNLRKRQATEVTHGCVWHGVWRMEHGALLVKGGVTT